MEEWHVKTKDLKNYPHFDRIISASYARNYATNEARIRSHCFYPFIRYEQRWTRFAKRGERGKRKTRPIRYAARLDACIFAYYRHVLSHYYELEISRLGLSENVLAYRRTPIANRKGGKCNIHFAYDAFMKLRQMGNCCAITLDVSDFFESLDHARLKQLWCRIIGNDKLPADHFQVFKAITRYAEVGKLRVYERLGHFGAKLSKKSGSPTVGYLTPYRKIPRQLCNGREFREKIAANGPAEAIIHKNQNPFGIPQGAPISDVLANLYLIDFDTVLSETIRGLGGAYYRYSDDILILVPGDEDCGREIMERARALISDNGSRLQIKREKSSLMVFSGTGGDQSFSRVAGKKGRNGLEYLGFRYDGKRVYLRNSTVSNLHRKVVRLCRREARSHARRYADKDLSRLRQVFDYEKLMQRFGKVRDFEAVKDKHQNWTFWTYVKRASGVFGDLGKPIPRQLRWLRESVRWHFDQQLAQAVAFRGRLP